VIYKVYYVCKLCAEDDSARLLLISKKVGY
jgi:hypothetical protein